VPSSLVAFKDALYFSNRDGEHGLELWRYSLATGAAPQLVADLAPGVRDSNPSGFAVLGEQLIFSTDNDVGGGLWTYDGSHDPAQLVSAHVRSILLTSPQTILFTGSDASHPSALWRYDGAGVPTLVADLDVGPFSLTIVNGSLHMVGDGSLWALSLDGRAQKVMADSGASLSGVGALYVAADGVAYFSGSDDVYHKVLWRYAGTGPAHLITDAQTTYSQFAFVDGVLYFVGVDRVHGAEPWLFDGTSARLLADLASGQHCECTPMDPGPCF